MKKILLMILCLLLISSVANAERIKGKGTDKLYLSINYENDNGRKYSFDNGLELTFSKVLVCNFMTSELVKNNPNCYWFKAGLLGIPYVLAVEGVRVDLINTTDKMQIVKWSESSISLGTYYGLPFFSGMKYKDIGNPSAMPDTIIPPHKKLSMDICIGEASWTNDGWLQGAAFVRADKSLKAALYLKVLDDKGAALYCTAESPAIIVPDYALAPFKKEK